MRRIAVVGRCQAAGIGDALMHMVDDCEVHSFVAQESYRDRMLPHAQKALAECDLIFSHYLYADHGFYSTENLRKEFGEVILIPPVVFSGFQPDCIDLIVGHSSHPSPLGSYHSAIVAAAYSLDVPSDRVETLFNKFVYQRLGYYQEFAKARTYLHSSMKAFGIDISGEWPDWVKSGVFMHSYNHPKPIVLASLAKLLAIKAGLVPADTPTPELGFDFLSHFPIWPVYPELAQALGTKGSYTFKKAGTPVLIEGTHTLMGLREFVQKSYELYGDVPQEAFDLPVVAKTREVLAPLLIGS